MKKLSSLRIFGLILLKREFSLASSLRMKIIARSFERVGSSLLGKCMDLFIFCFTFWFYLNNLNKSEHGQAKAARNNGGDNNLRQISSRQIGSF